MRLREHPREKLADVPQHGVLVGIAVQHPIIRLAIETVRSPVSATSVNCPRGNVGRYAMNASGYLSCTGKCAPTLLITTSSGLSSLSNSISFAAAAMSRSRTLVWSNCTNSSMSFFSVSVIRFCRLPPVRWASMYTVRSPAFFAYCQIDGSVLLMRM